MKNSILSVEDNKAEEILLARSQGASYVYIDEVLWSLDDLLALTPRY